MKKIYALLTAVTLTMVYNNVSAEPVDSGPPAQQQKGNVTDSNSHGDYLPAQPDENGANADAQSQDKKAMEHNKKHNKKMKKPAAAVKGKEQTNDPEEGGVDVK